MTDDKPTFIPTFGYKAGEAKIFDLKPGEKLPAGWADTPQPDAPAEPEKKAKGK